MSLVRSVIELPRRVRIADIVVIVVLAGFAYWMAAIAKEWRSPMHAQVIIHTDFRYLPLYTLFSLARGIFAYVISLLFTLIIGYSMAHSERVEKIGLPMLDIMQSIPVLSFIPGLSMAFLAIFPVSNIGLELVAIVAIFTGQVWNMTYAFYAALKGIPGDMRDATTSFFLSRREKLTKLELPASAIPLIWNSMMSMAGGWFFLTVCEAFTIGDKNYKLPGIGSYMRVAIEEGKMPAIIGAIVAMGMMIILLDRLLWRPLVIWSTKFRMEEISDDLNGVPERSIVLDIVSRSKLVQWLSAKLSVKEDNKRKAHSSEATVPIEDIKSRTVQKLASFVLHPHYIRKGIGWLAVIGFATGISYAIFRSYELLSLHLGSDDWGHIGIGTLATLARTFCAVFLAALWTVPLGAMIGMNARLSRKLQPAIQFMASFPAPMIFPLVLLLLAKIHLSIEYGAVILMLLGTQWYMLFNVIAGASALPADLVELGRSFSLPRIQRWRKIILPSLFPSIVTGLLTAAGGAWNTSIIAENYDVPGKTRQVATGVGALISFASDHDNIPLLVASTLSLCIVVVTINRLVWRKMLNAAQNKYSLNK